MQRYSPFGQFSYLILNNDMDTIQNWLTLKDFLWKLTKLFLFGLVLLIPTNFEWLFRLTKIIHVMSFSFLKTLWEQFLILPLRQFNVMFFIIKLSYPSFAGPRKRLFVLWPLLPLSKSDPT